MLDQFLHPQALGLLHKWVQSHPLAEAWRLPAYSLTDLAQHMGMLLPANWWQRPQPAANQAELQALVSTSGRDDAPTRATKAAVRSKSP